MRERYSGCDVKINYYVTFTRLHSIALNEKAYCRVQDFSIINVYNLKPLCFSEFQNKNNESTCESLSNDSYIKIFWTAVAELPGKHCFILYRVSNEYNIVVNYT